MQSTLWSSAVHVLFTVIRVHSKYGHHHSTAVLRYDKGNFLAPTVCDSKIIDCNVCTSFHN